MMLGEVKARSGPLLRNYLGAEIWDTATGSVGLSSRRRKRDRLRSSPRSASHWSLLDVTRQLNKPRPLECRGPRLGYCLTATSALDLRPSSSNAFFHARAFLLQCDEKSKSMCRKGSLACTGTASLEDGGFAIRSVCHR